MWKSVIKAATPFSKLANILTSENALHLQLRTTFILKRQHAPRLHGKGCSPKQLKSKNHIYELVKNTNVEKQAEVEVILTKFVDGLGNAGDCIKVKEMFAYDNLLLPGFAIYPSKHNLEKFKDVEVKDIVHYSSPKVLMVMTSLQRHVFSLIMNKHQPWTLQPWHIRASLRKCGFIVPEDAITMPKQEIKGPDLDLEGKIFQATITINKTETVKIKCQIHHWSTDIKERLPFEQDFWKKPEIYMFEEDTDSDKK